MAVTVSTFPSCCGASIVTGFETFLGTSVYDPAQGKYITRPPDQDKHAYMINTLQKKCRSMYNGHQYVAVLNAAQREFGWEKALLECGFIPIRAWINGVHNSHLVMYSMVFSTKGDPTDKILDDKYVFTAEGRPKQKKVEKTLAQKIIDPFGK